MKIMLNNRAEIIEGDVFSVSQILVIKSFKFRMLVVRLNDRLIKKEEYETTLVKDGDDLKVIHLVSGG